MRYVRRREYIVSAARGKSVLDLGFIGEVGGSDDERIAAFPQQLHYELAQVGDEVVGVDYSRDIVALLQQRYPHLRLVASDVCELSRHIDRPFDVVVMGDLIEHLDNPGLALDAIRPFVGRVLIVSCPNALGLPNYVRFVLGRFREGSDHVLSFNRFTLEHLLTRHGYTVVEVMTCLDRSPSSWFRRCWYRPFLIVLRLFPAVGGTLLLVARPTSRC
ncbi:MAG: methyltransferase domain-containing protein [Gaiellaceae bacterium]